MSPLMIDLVIVVVLALFAWRGAKKGLILTLFSLVAFFVAFVGARAISVRFAQPVADIIRPSIQLSVDEMLAGELALPEAEGNTVADGDAVTTTHDLTLQQILTLLEENELFGNFRDYLEEAIEDNRVAVAADTAAAVVDYLSHLIATALLFCAGFVLILFIWLLASRALDLAFKLPILSWVNTAGGLIFGLVKGILVVLVLVWIARLMGWLHAGNTGPITSLMSADKLSALFRSVVAGTYVP